MPRLVRNFVFLFPALFVGVLVKSFVLKILWGWFLVPLVTSVPLSFIQCFGTLLIVALCSGGFKTTVKTKKTTTEKTETKHSTNIEDLPPELREKVEQSIAQVADSFGDAIFSAGVSPLTLLFIGWIVHLFL